MILLENLTDFAVPMDTLRSIAARMTEKDIELILCEDTYIQDLNRQFRGKDSVTDVLSFPLSTKRNHEPLGSIVISIDQVIKEAQQYGHSPQNELTLLFIHGLLHLLGYDHEIDEGEMRAMEERLVRYFALPLSLIVRTKEL